ncbi:MAG: cupin domain-containing protein [Gammaproteobacteria bacterium]|nr:cupin domain-containing protein [Gammaproteobacteria bacterium]MCP5202251.1 cupin domain-containing protein [Gammaproteobacteria bacterium]
MARPPVVLTPAQREPALDLVGERLTVLVDRDQTNGYEVFLQEGVEGSGPPPHHHDWDEAFFVIDGAVDFGVGEREMTATAGSFVHLPGGTTHWFRFCAGGGRMLSLTGAGSGAAGFFRAVAAAIPDGRLDVDKLTAVADQHEVRFGPPS